MPTKSYFSVILKDARLSAGLSTLEAAKRCDLTQRMWQYYESGAYTPTSFVQRAMLNVLKVLTVAK